MWTLYWFFIYKGSLFIFKIEEQEIKCEKGEASGQQDGLLSGQPEPSTSGYFMGGVAWLFI